MYGVAPRTSFALRMVAFVSAPVDVWAVWLRSTAASSGWRADTADSATTIIAANAVVPTWTPTGRFHRSNGLMLPSCEHMKPDRPDGLHQTKVSTTPSYRWAASMDFCARVAHPLVSGWPGPYRSCRGR